MTVPLSG